MKGVLIVAGAGLMLAACSRSPQAAPPEVKAETKEPLKATVWTAEGELYLEYPALVRNRTERFAIHLTRLTDFRAVKEAECEVHLNRNGASQVFPCDPSTHPGIFGANVQPESAGEARLQIVVHGRDLNETFDAGAVKIAADAASAEKPPESKEESISFSKEQQWALDFGTQLAAVQNLREDLRVAAETLPRAGGAAVVIAPISGRVIVEKTLAVGTPVENAATLASMIPPTSTVSDLASLQLAEAEAKISVEQAQRDRARAERLLAAGAVPARRAEEARTAEASAQARLEAARTRLAQYDATRTADGVETGARRFFIRAPITGVIAESRAVNGANVESGTVLFRIVDIDTLFVSGVVPESELSRLRGLSGAELEMPDTGQMRPANRLVAIGRLVDAETRTVPVTYEIDNRDHRLAVNQTVFLRLLLTPTGMMPAIPESAIIDDAGRPVVFVQKGGETFLRRPVKLGVHNSGMVQVLEGISAGDRVVTRGAYLIRLSTMSSAVPAHGHVH
jgi:RND family efflux transporter MFP subunit